MKWGFDTVSIGKLVSPVKNWDPRKCEINQSFTYIDIASVNRETRIIEKPTEVDAHEAPSRARQLVQSNDVLVSTVRPNLNAVAQVESSLDGATASTGFTVLRPKQEKLDSRYLYYWVRTPYFVEDMTRQSTGASYPAVSDSIVKDYFIPLPPLAEQRRIAAILDKADAIRRKRKQAIQYTEELLSSTFLDMFGDPVTNPRDWVRKPLLAVVHPQTIVTYGIVQAGPEVENGVPYIRTGDIKDGRIVEDNLLRTAPEIAQKFKRSEVHTGDLVMSIRATVGTIAEVTPSLNGANLTQGTAKISPGPEVKGSYLFEFIRSGGCQEWLQRQVKGATFREITLKRLREMPVMIPPLLLQSEFDKVVQQMKDANDKHVKADRESDNLFNSLLQRAFRGEL